MCLYFIIRKNKFNVQSFTQFSKYNFGKRPKVTIDCSIIFSLGPCAIYSCLIYGCVASFQRAMHILEYNEHECEREIIYLEKQLVYNTVSVIVRIVLKLKSVTLTILEYYKHEQKEKLCVQKNR